MSFGKKSGLLTWILIALIPIGAGAGVLIGWSVFGGTGGGTEVTLDIRGSTTVEPICIATATIFMNVHPNVQVTIQASGSGTGITALIDGQANIAMSSRPVKSSENTTAHDQHSLYLKQYAIAKDGLAVIINSAATSDLDLNITMIRMIFNGSILTWDDARLPSVGLTGAIQVIARDSASGTRGTFDDLVMDDDDYVADFQEKVSNQEVVDDVGSNAQAIGYCGLAYLNDDVDAVIVDGVEASKETIVAGTYQLSRNLYLVTLGTPAANTLIFEYVQWHFSPTGQFYIDEVGYIAIQDKKDEI